MSEAPERIWACVSNATKSGISTVIGNAKFPVDGWQEYIRADRIEELEAERDALREALEWYGEQAKLARLIHSEGDAGRHVLAEDGGDRARAALNRETDT